MQQSLLLQLCISLQPPKLLQLCIFFQPAQMLQLSFPSMFSMENRDLPSSSEAGKHSEEKGAKTSTKWSNEQASTRVQEWKESQWSGKQPKSGGLAEDFNCSKWGRSTQKHETVQGQNTEPETSIQGCQKQQQQNGSRSQNKPFLLTVWWGFGLKASCNNAWSDSVF